MNFAQYLANCNPSLAPNVAQLRNQITDRLSGKNRETNLSNAARNGWLGPNTRNVSFSSPIITKPHFPWHQNWISPINLAGSILQSHSNACCQLAAE